MESYLFVFDRVTDEKDARSYLQALAAKMTEEMDSLRMSGTPTAVCHVISRSLKNVANFDRQPNLINDWLTTEICGVVLLSVPYERSR